MKFLVDMNLSPDWIQLLERNGWEAVHWSQIGNPGARDSEIMEWAAKNKHILFSPTISILENY